MKRTAGIFVVAGLALAGAGCRCGDRSSDAGGSDATVPSDAAPGTDASTNSDATIPSDAAACGDPLAAANYMACTSATDQPACEAAGGAWTTIGLSPSESCQCPTGQGTCPCTRPSDCLSACIAPSGPGGLFDCAGITSGYCSSVSVTVGCWCYFDETGMPTGYCVD